MTGTSLAALKGFDIGAASVSLWVFKKQSRAGHPSTFTGRWVDTAPALRVALRTTIAAQRDGIEEVQEYALLAQNNEASALTIDAIETSAGVVIDAAAAETPERKITRVKDLQNSVFYVVKLISSGKLLHAFRKTDSSWRSRKSLTSLSALFSDSVLTIEEAPTVEISKHVDFFVVDGHIIIKSKAGFESILNYKQAHQEDFARLKNDATFSGVFSDIQVLSDFVGTNKIHLRRASAIRQKGHYKDPRFMTNLRARCQEFGLHLQFDDAGRIVPTEKSCRDIFTALLDHRLASAFSTNIYDVPDATQINT